MWTVVGRKAGVVEWQGYKSVHVIIPRQTEIRSDRDPLTEIRPDRDPLDRDPRRSRSAQIEIRSDRYPLKPRSAQTEIRSAQDSLSPRSAQPEIRSEMEICSQRSAPTEIGSDGDSPQPQIRSA